MADRDSKTKENSVKPLADSPMLRQPAGSIGAGKACRECFSCFVENSMDLICELDASGRYLYVNKAFATVLGYDCRVLLGSPAFGHLHPQDKIRTFRQFAARRRNEQACKLIFRYCHAEGHYLWFESVVNLALDSEGNITRLFVSSRDITERKRLEEELKESESHYRDAVLKLKDDIRKRRKAEQERLIAQEQLGNIFNSLDIVFWSYDVVLQKTIRISPACIKICGWPEKAFYEDPALWGRLVHPGDKKLYENNQPNLYAGRPLDYEYRIIHRSGKIIWVHDRTIPVFDTKGVLIRLDGMVTDITEKKLAEAGLKRRDRLLMGVAGASHYLLTEPDIDKALQGSLKILGRAAQADRAYIVEICRQPDGQTVMKLRCEWERPNVTAWAPNSFLHNALFGDSAIAASWYDSLQKGLPVCAKAGDFDGADKEVLWRQGVLSFIAVPIFTGPCLWGFIGLDDCRHERDWARSERTVLVAAAAGIGGALERARAQAALRESEARYRSLIKQSYDGVVILEPRTLRIQEANARFCELFGYKEQEISSLTFYDIIIAERTAVDEKLRELFVEKHVVCNQRLFRRKDGSELEAEVLVAAIEYAGSTVIMANIRDLTERKAVESKLRLGAAVYENTIEGIMVTDSKGIIVSVNPAFTAMTGYTQDEAVGRNPRILQSGRHKESFYKKMWQTLVATGRWKGEVWNRRKTGELFAVWQNISAITDEEGRHMQYVSVFSDITARKKYESQIRRQAYHDPLTGLPNRVLFYDRLAVALAAAQRNRRLMAVLFLDLDDFKRINDAYGHEMGDLLLKAVAGRLMSAVRRSDTVARLGGDEFIVLLTDIKRRSDANLAAWKVVNTLKEPFAINGRSFAVSASAGIAVYPQDGEDPQTLINRADSAMYATKNR